MSSYHTSVLLGESLRLTISSPGGTYIDATFGGGGHTRGMLDMLSASGRVLAFDLDSEALAQAPDDPRLTTVHANFKHIRNFAYYLDADNPDPRSRGRVDGILADLGVSSHQFDTPERGFSFRFDAPLDMRMNPDAGVTAEEVVATYSQEELERILRLYGEVDRPAYAATLIVKARQAGPLHTTQDLAEALSPILPKAAPHKVLAKVFQALRIEVNGEMRSLERFLGEAALTLKDGGKIAVITYHSLEDRMVKNFFKSGSVIGETMRDVFGRSIAPLEPIVRKPILPGEDEIASNTRARSAKLRAARRVPQSSTEQIQQY